MFSAASRFDTETIRVIPTFRVYISTSLKGMMLSNHGEWSAATRVGARARAAGRCRLIVSQPELKARLVSALETII